MHYVDYMLTTLSAHSPTHIYRWTGNDIDQKCNSLTSAAMYGSRLNHMHVAYLPLSRPTRRVLVVRLVDGWYTVNVQLS
jgi:hypothetical protein